MKQSSNKKIPNSMVFCKYYLVCLIYVKKDIRKPPTLVGGAFSDKTFSKNWVIFKNLNHCQRCGQQKKKSWT